MGNTRTETVRRNLQSSQDKALGKLAYRRWVSDRTLAEYYEVSRATIWRWVKIGKLPAPQKIGENCTRWDFEVIQSNENVA
jgi:prophage regulatory protein